MLRAGSERIGPDEARELLERLWPDYRAVNPRFVRYFAEEMRRGLWRPDRSTIKVDTRPERGLVDGRRRLLAVIEAGVEVEFRVVRGEFETIGEAWGVG